MKIDKLKPGAVVYTVKSQKMGNTTMRTVAVHAVSVLEVDLDQQRVRARWNGNRECWYAHADWSKWRAERPLLIQDLLGKYRLATKAEIAASKTRQAARLGDVGHNRGGRVG